MKDLIQQWREVAASLKALRAQELELRKAIVAANFENAQEGVNTVELSNGAKLKATIKFNRTVDEAAVNTNYHTFVDKYGIPMDSIIHYKPLLVTAQYKKLPEKFRYVLDQVITTKPGAPSLTYVDAPDSSETGE